MTDHIIEETNEDSTGDSTVEILCEGVVLNPYIQLKVAREKYWKLKD